MSLQTRLSMSPVQKLQQEIVDLSGGLLKALAEGFLIIPCSAAAARTIIPFSIMLPDLLLVFTSNRSNVLNVFAKVMLCTKMIFETYLKKGRPFGSLLGFSDSDLFIEHDVRILLLLNRHCMLLEKLLIPLICQPSAYAFDLPKTFRTLGHETQNSAITIQTMITRYFEPPDPRTDPRYTTPTDPSPSLLYGRKDQVTSQVNSLLAISRSSPHVTPLAGESSGRRIAITGPPKIGKTAIAVSVLRHPQIKKAYTRQYYLDFKQWPHTLDTILSVMLQFLGADGNLSDLWTMDDLWDRMARQLAGQPLTLFCLDHFEQFLDHPLDRKLVHGLLQFLSSLPSLVVVVVSENIGWAGDGCGSTREDICGLGWAAVETVGPLSTKASRAFLSSQSSFTFNADEELWLERILAYADSILTVLKEFSSFLGNWGTRCPNLKEFWLSQLPVTDKSWQYRGSLCHFHDTSLWSRRLDHHVKVVLCILSIFPLDVIDDEDLVPDIKQILYVSGLDIDAVNCMHTLKRLGLVVEGMTVDMGTTSCEDWNNDKPIRNHFWSVLRTPLRRFCRTVKSHCQSRRIRQTCPGRGPESTCYEPTPGNPVAIPQLLASKPSLATADSETLCGGKANIMGHRLRLLVPFRHYVISHLSDILDLSPYDDRYLQRLRCERVSHICTLLVVIARSVKFSIRLIDHASVDNLEWFTHERLEAALEAISNTLDLLRNYPEINHTEFADAERVVKNTLDTYKAWKQVQESSR